MSCAACCTVILDDEEYLRCTQGGCAKMYHTLCTSGNKITPSTGGWICPECCCRTKKGGDNSFTPVGAAKKSRDPNITYRAKIPATVETAPNFESSFSLSSEIRSLRNEVSLLRDQLSKAVSLISGYETKLAGYSSSVEALRDQLNKREVCYASATVASDQSKPIDAAPEKVRITTSDTPVALKPKQKKSDNKITHLPPSPVLLASPSHTVLPKPVAENASSSVNLDVQSRPCPATPNHRHTDDMQQWTEVRRIRRPASLYGKAGPAVTSLKAVEPRSYIHLWNMESSAEEVRDYLCQLCPGGNCTVVELTTKGDYKSYKIGVPVAFYETCLSIEVWPINARIKTWVVYSKKPIGPVPRKFNQPFRSTTASQ